MAHKSLLECSFLVPVRRDKEISDGKLHPEKRWKWLNEELFALVGGRTLAPGYYQGLWLNPKTGAPVSDESRRFIVAVPRKRLNEFRQLLVRACVVFHQQAIYLSVAGKVELIEAEA